MIAVIVLTAERYDLTLAQFPFSMLVVCHLLALVIPFALSVSILLFTRI